MLHNEIKFESKKDEEGGGGVTTYTGSLPLGHCRSVWTIQQCVVLLVNFLFFYLKTVLNLHDYRILSLYTVSLSLEMSSERAEYTYAAVLSTKWPPFLPSYVHPLMSLPGLSLSWRTEVVKPIWLINFLKEFNSTFPMSEIKLVQYFKRDRLCIFYFHNWFS